MSEPSKEVVVELRISLIYHWTMQSNAEHAMLDQSNIVVV